MKDMQLSEVKELLEKAWERYRREPEGIKNMVSGLFVISLISVCRARLDVNRNCITSEEIAGLFKEELDFVDRHYRI